MGSQRGPINYTGSIGNLRNYTLKGVAGIVVATKGGPTKAQVETLPSMLLTRQNNNEIKGVTLCTRLTRAAMFSGFRPYYDSNITGRWNELFKAIQLADFDNPRGQRVITNSDKASWFSERLVLNPNKPVSSIFFADAVGSHDVTAQVWTMTLSPYTSFRYIKFHGKETHYRFRQMIFTVPDVGYSSVSGLYSDASNLAAPVHVEAVSDWFGKTDEAPVIVPIVINLPDWGYAFAKCCMLQIIVIEMAVLEGAVYTLTQNFGVGLLDAVNVSQ